MAKDEHSVAEKRAESKPPPSSSPPTPTLVSPAMRGRSKGQSPLSPSLPPYHDCMWGRTVFTWLADDPPQLWRGGDWRTLNCWVSFVIYEEA